MSCGTPSQLTDEQISRWLDGYHDTEVKFHLEQCPACRNRLDMARLIETRLQQAIYRKICPSSDELIDYSMEFLDDERMLEIEMHLEECLSCQQELSTCIDFVERENMTQTQEPYRQGTIIYPPKGYFSVVLVEHQSVRAVRGHNKRSFRASANGIQILCDVQQTAKGLTLIGTVIEDIAGSGWTQCLLEIRQNDSVVHLCPLDTFDMFRCESIKEGTYSIRLVAPDGRVLEISNVEVGL